LHSLLNGLPPLGGRSPGNQRLENRHWTPCAIRVSTHRRDLAERRSPKVAERRPGAGAAAAGRRFLDDLVGLPFLAFRRCDRVGFP
jgi:hypothetical protein